MVKIPNPLDLLRRATGVIGDPAVLAELARTMVFELIPLKNLEAQIPSLPPGSPVSVTCSPAKGIGATLELAARLQDLGHHPTPHISARLVTGPDHVAELAAWFRSHSIHEMFLVGGDAETPAGPYEDAAGFLRDFLAQDHGLHRIGVTAYPDGHGFIPREKLREALHIKQSLLAEAGLKGFASTQMCLDPALVKSWLTGERAAGLKLPIQLGIPGVIDRTKLLTMGMKLGVGSSIRYAKKNRGALGQLFNPLGYDPLQLLQPLSQHATALGIGGLHTFTFNNVTATAAWREGVLKLGRSESTT